MNSDLENRGGVVILFDNSGSLPSAAAKSAPVINYPGYKEA
jgi:hypothetical protein